MRQNFHAIYGKIRKKQGSEKMKNKTSNIGFIALDGTLELKPTGEIDHHSAAAMRKEADELICRYKPARVELNLEKIEFMDSSGLGFIMGRFALAEKNGGVLVVKKPSKSVQKICRLAGLERIITIIK